MGDHRRLATALAGRYSIDREIGSGGMATVYLAEDLKHHRPVAIKVLKPELSAVVGSERFLAEIETTARLQHPNILPLFDSGEAGGFLYYVMPRVEGESLRGRLNREKQLAIDDALKITVEVADALASAHRQGIVHRDIKPENILLHEGHALVADFGIALAAKTAGVQRLTGTGFSLGTPAYMSPEQATAEPELDARSDVYSLACVLYEMLAGQPPFTGASAQVVIARHLVDSPPPVTTARPGVSQGVARAIARALGKAPADRYATVRDFADALLAPDSSPEETARRSVAVLPLENLTGDPGQEFFVDGMTEALITGLARIKGLKVISRTSVMTYKGARKPLPEIARDLDVGTVLEGSVFRSADRVRVTVQLIDAVSDEHLWAESYDRSLDDVLALQSDVAAAIATEIRSALTPSERQRLQATRAVDPVAHDLYLKGRQSFFTYSEKGFRKADRYFGLATDRDPKWALPHAALAESCWFQSYTSTTRPSELLARARSAAAKALELDDTLGDPLALLAMVRVIEEYDWVRAGAEFARAIELSPQSYTPHMIYGSTYLNFLGHHDQAEREVRFCMELDPLNPAPALELAFVLYLGRRFDDAIRQLRKAMELDPHNPMAVCLLGLALEELSAFDEAVEAMEKAADLAQGAPFFEVLLAQGYAAAGRPDEASGILRDRSRLWPEVYTSPYYTAAAFAALERNDEAFEWLDRAWNVRDSWLGMAGQDPALDALRTDPRFDELLRRINLPARAS